jgi:hypothetical protein
MASGDPIESRTVGPLPLLQRLIRAIGIPDVINDSVRWDPTRRVLSPGERIEGLILNILGGQRPLYRVHEFFEETATELLFHEGVTLEQWDWGEREQRCDVEIRHGRSRSDR